jgi:uncharacterized integral membrane protein (TIGR00697 family)
MKLVRFDVLVALYVFGIMVAQLMGAKTFPLANVGELHLTASVAIFVMPLLFTITDVITEIYGKERARSVVRTGLMVIALQLVAAVAFTALPASARFLPSEVSYDAIFGTSIRFALAGIAAFAIAELLDVAVFSKIRQRLGNSKLWLRNNVSNFVSQLADSTVFVVLAFYAIDMSLGSNAGFLIGIILPYWLIRCTLSVLETPLVYLGVKWLKPSVVPQQSSKVSEGASI